MYKKKRKEGKKKENKKDVKVSEGADVKVSLFQMMAPSKTSSNYIGGFLWFFWGGSL